jgi:aminotransferase in exopolysaccharide biosynthesis
MDEYIPLSVPCLNGNELKYVSDAIVGEWIAEGKYIGRFENEISKYVRMPEAVACQSGTAGLHLALLALNIQREHEIIVPTLTFVAAVNPVRYIGAEPVFMDCDDSLCMDMRKLESFCHNNCDFLDGKLINRATKKQISAIIVVHVFGNLADMEHLTKIAQKYNLPIIEDATEALGSKYIDGSLNGMFAGTIGDIGVYSFNGNKIISTGGGGMIVSKHKELLDRMRHLSTQAKVDPVYYVHDEVGYNYRMTNLQAALGVAQLEQLEVFIEKKNKNYNLYNELGLALLPFSDGIRPNYWFYSYLSDKRDKLISFLTENRVQSRPIWRLIYELPFYDHAQSYHIEKAKYYHAKIVNIPCSSNLSPNNANRVAALINSFKGD